MLLYSVAAYVNMMGHSVPTWTYNYPGVINEKISCVFQYDKSNTDYDTVLDTNLKSVLSEYWTKYCNGEAQPFFDGEKSDHYFVGDVDNRNSSDWYEFNTFDGNFWQQLFHLSSGYTAEDIQPIVTVRDSDFANFEQSLKVDDYYKAELTAAYTAAKANNETLQIFRFAQSEYFAAQYKSDSYFADSSLWLTGKDDGGFVAQEQIYMDFDILSLTFVKDGKDTILPVAASPINAIAPLETPSETLWDKFAADMPVWVKILMVIAIVMVALLVLKALSIVAPVLKPVFQVVMFVLLLPFKIIKWIYKAIQNRNSK